MMPTVVVCYPADTVDGSKPAAACAPEYLALQAQGVPVGLLSAEWRFISAAGPVAHAQMLWRGGSLSTGQYQAMESTLAAQGLALRVTHSDYRRAHLLPGWLGNVLDHCAATRLVPESHFEKLPLIAEKLGWWPLKIRSFAASDEQLETTSANAEELLGCLPAWRNRLKLTEGGGLALQRPEGIVPGSERRFFIWQQNVWPHPRCDEDATALARLVARNFWHPFFVADIAQREDGRWRLLGIGDAQTCQQREWSTAQFTEFLRLSLYPHLP